MKTSGTCALVFGLVLVGMLVGLPGLAQDRVFSAAPQPDSEQRTVPTNPGAPPGGDSGSILSMAPLLTRFEFWLTLLVVSFGTTVIAMQFFLLRRHEATSDEILKVFAVTLIVVGSLVLITAGFDDQQIAPAMGLFGTISGYLLGRASGSKGTKADSANKPTGDEL